MKVNDFMSKAHLKIQAYQGKKYTQKQMATCLNIKMRTYVEYLRGTNEPLAMKALLNMLVMLPENDVIELLNSWKYK